MNFKTRNPSRNKRLIAWLLVFCCGGLMGGVMIAKSQNEIAQLLEEANDAFDKGYLRLASTRMTQALNLIKELEGQRAKRLFPEPLAGWKTSDDAGVEEFKTLGVGSLLMTARNYLNGDTTVQMVLIQKPSAPAPLFNMLLMGLTLPKAGGEVVPVESYKGNLSCKQEAPKQCELLVSLEEDYLLMLNGKNADKDTLLHYAKSFRYAGLKDLR